jgi:3-hydroxybutyryl-CoA dehydrogenase
MKMNINDVKKICVVGAGVMGHQISLLCAIQGYQTTCVDTNAEILKKAENFTDTYLPGRVKKGKLTEEEARRARTNIAFTSDLQEAVKEADYVIEAIIESLAIKKKVFQDLDRLAPEHAILSTNSSRIVSSQIAVFTKRPSKVLNLHFNNPALVMKLVEVVQGPHVSDETARISMDLCSKLGKVAIHLKKEVEGFCVGRIIGTIMKEALWMYEMGVASPEDIDKACVFGAGHPMGPFRLMDLTGIDLEYTMKKEKFIQTGDPADLPSPGVVEKYFQGHLGEKTGKGWYDYSTKK